VIPHRPARRTLPSVIALLALVVLSACEARARIEVVAETDGSGRVAVLVGLDEAALARLGDPATGLALDDLARAGWRVDGPLERDGTTWWRAAKPFATPGDLQPTVDEVAGPGGILSDFAFEEGPVDGGTSYVVSGTVDLAEGLEALAEPELTEVLGGDPFGGYVEALEAEEGRPVRDMLTVQAAVEVDGSQQVADLRPGDPAVTLEATRVVEDPAPVWPWAVGALVVVASATTAAVAMARRRSRRPATT
jgi:hypothetical protein